MMNTGQRVALVKQRALPMRRSRARHTLQRLSLLSVLLCCGLIYAAGVFSDSLPGTVQGMSGATMLLGNAGGYVLVGVVCFVAAVATTVLCLHARDNHHKQDKQTEEEKEK